MPYLIECPKCGQIISLIPDPWCTSLWDGGCYIIRCKYCSTDSEHVYNKRKDTFYPTGNLLKRKDDSMCITKEEYKKILDKQQITANLLELELEYQDKLLDKLVDCRNNIKNYEQRLDELARTLENYDTRLKEE